MVLKSLTNHLCALAILSNHETLVIIIVGIIYRLHKLFEEDENRKKKEDQNERKMYVA